MARKKTPDVMGDLLGEKSQSPSTPSQPSPSEEAASVPGTEVTANVIGSGVLHIVDKYAIWASGIGLIPVPVVDIVALSALQMKMLSALAQHYEVHFSQSSGRAIVASLLSSVGANSLRQGMLGSVAKSIPLMGWAIGWFVMPLAAGALTYAVGKVFAQHFASGGTFIDCDLGEFKNSFKGQYRLGLSRFHQRESGS